MNQILANIWFPEEKNFPIGNFAASLGQTKFGEINNMFCYINLVPHPLQKGAKVTKPIRTHQEI